MSGILNTIVSGSLYNGSFGSCKDCTGIYNEVMSRGGCVFIEIARFPCMGVKCAEGSFGVGCVGSMYSFDAGGNHGFTQATSAVAKAPGAANGHKVVSGGDLGSQGGDMGVAECQSIQNAIYEIMVVIAYVDVVTG